MVKSVVDEQKAKYYVAMSEYDPKTGLILEQRPESGKNRVFFEELTRSHHC